MIIRPVETNASGVESDGPLDRCQYGIEREVRSVIDVLKWSFTMSQSTSHSAPHSG